jgi:hypothetical protein
MTRTIRLRAPTTTGTVSVGGVEHQIVDGYVTIRRDEVDALLASHGFEVAGPLA